MKNFIIILILLFTSTALFPNTQAITQGNPVNYRQYTDVVQKTAWMVSDGTARTLAQKQGL